eukprot:scaffold12617_cov155-Isochrysis_galbana.AAC.2
MSSPLTSAPHTDARSPRTARSKNWMIFRKYPTYRLPSAYRWYSVPTKRLEAKQAHAPEIFAIPAEDLREDKKSSQYLPSWDFRLLEPTVYPSYPPHRLAGTSDQHSPGPDVSSRVQCPAA